LWSAAFIRTISAAVNAATCPTSMRGGRLDHGAHDHSLIPYPATITEKCCFVGKLLMTMLTEMTQQRLNALDTSFMTRIAQSLTGSPRAVFVHWHYDMIQGGAGGGIGGTAVYGFTGDIQDGEATFPASLMLKVLYATTHQQLEDIYYWKREVHAYQSGLLPRLSGNLVAPRCLAVVDYPEACWLWLEAIVGATGDAWSLDDYRMAACHLGQFGSAYLQSAALPNWPWLTRDFIRQDSALGQAIPQVHHALGHPVMQQLLPDASAEKLRRLWNERESFLVALQRLPHTLCHFDAFRRNLFIRVLPGREPQTVAIDWSFVGRGPIGAELVSLVWVSLLFGEVAPELAVELDRLAFEGYLEGLRSGGWTGDPKLARFGYTASIGLRRIGTLGILVSLLERNEWTPEAEMIDAIVKNGLFIEELTDEARTLLPILDS
jgi:hypothetical protein